MADNSGVKALLDAAWRQPVAAATLFSVIVGGTLVYGTVIHDAHELRKELDELKATYSRTTGKFEHVQTEISGLRTDIREVITNVRWLMKRDRATLDLEDENRRGGPR
jgi:hypothetical protein